MYLGIDCGTQGTKALIIDESGRPLGRGYAPHALLERSSGAREQDPQWWIDALIISVKQALKQAGPTSSPVRALGVSGQQHGLVVLDENFTVIRPAKLWNDTETAPQNAELIERFGGREAWLDRFGMIPMTGYTVSKLLWIAQSAPADFARIRHILLPHDYLNWWLTGRMRAEFGDASGTGFFDNRSRQWRREVLDSIDGGTGQLFAALPQLVEVGEVVGTLRPEVSAELGMTSKCVVSAGGGDNMMGAIGTGNVREGMVTLSLGTSSTVCSFSERPVKHPSAEVAPFCSSSGGWLPLVCTMNATNVVTATVKLLGKTVEDIDAALKETVPGADGVVFLPFLNGERTPDLPNARGTLTGLSSTNFHAANLIRATVEGVSFGILNGLDRILGGKRTDVIQVIGGGAQSRGWRQLLADATGARVLMPSEQEAGCLGAAIQACVTWELSQGRSISFVQAVDRLLQVSPKDAVEPNPGLREGYDAARKHFQRELANLYSVE